MPTGYTSGVEDGTVTEFSEYAIQCARAFGACVTMRDDPLDSQIPEFVPSEYYYASLAEAQKNVEEFTSMSEHDREAMWKQKSQDLISEAKRMIEKANQVRRRYEDMLAKAMNFKSPTPEHDKYAAFLVSQLQESIKFDCDTSYYESMLQHNTSFEEWKIEYITSLLAKLESCKQRLSEEVERVAKRNKWVNQLKQELKYGNSEQQVHKASNGVQNS